MHLSDLAVCTCLKRAYIIWAILYFDSFLQDNIFHKLLYEHNLTTLAAQQRGTPPSDLIIAARVEWYWADADAKAEPGSVEIGWTGLRGCVLG